MFVNSPVIRSLLAVLLIGALAPGQAAEIPPTLARLLTPLPVADGIWYFRGSIDQRSFENQGFNLNTGFVITSAGVVVIDAGPAFKVARAMADAIATVTDQPIVAVINTGSQDHRWLGNGWFAAHGIPIIALQRTVTTQRHYAPAHMERLQAILREGFAGTQPAYAEAPLATDHHRLRIGATTFEIIHAGDAHFPGDVMVWLPAQRVVFAGDLVYHDRLAGLHPWSSLTGLHQAFRALEALQPEIIVPGHGTVGDLAQARAESGDYYEFLLTEVGAALDDWEDLTSLVDRLAEVPQFRHLRHYEDWHRLNLNRAYLQLEVAQ